MSRGSRVVRDSRARRRLLLLRNVLRLALAS